VIGVLAGILARSTALVAFGLDSAIERLASVIVIWRFSGSRMRSSDESVDIEIINRKSK
jgi:divalent metal cation (Fe/Co/Zn/Cd) transporter